MISSKKYVDETLRNNNLVASKALGQNFLVEENIAKEITDSIDDINSHYVVEIGPGLGALTEFLVKKNLNVMVYEIDQNMVNILTNTFKDYKNITINHIDFMKVDLEEIATKYDNLQIISNLPYYITSKLLNKILVNNLPLMSMTFMMQKEVANKLVKPDKKDMNLLTIILDYFYKVEIVKYVGKNSYLPRPEIDSMVLKFTKIKPKKEVDFNTLVNVCHLLFENRRKTINNNLKSLLKEEDYIKLNLLPSLRVEQLNLDDILKIVEYLSIK